MLQETSGNAPRSLKSFSFSDSLSQDSIEIVIPEVVDPNYGMYVWPCAPVLAQYIWFNRSKISGKSILELGSGTALPGVLAAKLGADVTLTDGVDSPSCRENCLKSCQANGVENVQIVPLSWGQYSPDMICMKPEIILGSDCFYDTKDFENILITVDYFTEKNPDLEFWTTYQERSSDRTIEPLLVKWNLACRFVPLETFEAATSDIGGSDLPGPHTIQMLIITRRKR